VANNRNIMFMVFDPMGNRIVLYEKTWLQHTAAKRIERDERLPALGDVRESVLNPDQIRRSLHPVIGTNSCVFEKFIGPDSQLLRVPVLYDLAEGVAYDDPGRSEGHIMSTFYPDPPYQSRNVGEIFWKKSKDEEGE
jgi:hypothetical protein